MCHLFADLRGLGRFCQCAVVSSVTDPQPPTRTWRTPAYIAGFVALTVAVVVGSWLAGSNSPFAAAADSSHFEERKARVEELLAAHRYGYERAWAEEGLASMVEQVDANLAGDHPDPRILELAARDLEVVIAHIEEARAAWLVEFSVKDENLVNASGTDAEAALDLTTGGVSGFEVGECPDGARACVLRGTSTVVVPSRLAALTEAQLLEEESITWFDLMAHEYMHVLQGKLGSSLYDDQTYLSLFDLPPDGAVGYEDEVDWAAESSAECMAEAMYEEYYVRTYPGFCTDEQYEFARWILDEALAAE